MMKKVPGRCKIAALSQVQVLRCSSATCPGVPAVTSLTATPLLFALVVSSLLSFIKNNNNKNGTEAPLVHFGGGGGVRVAVCTAACVAHWMWSGYTRRWLR